MKTIEKLFFVITVVVIASCEKDPPIPTATGYDSVSDFFSKNNVAMQTYTIDGTTGGSFISPQGTIVTIPANAFLTQSTVPVSGSVTVQFKDIYKKSDMLLSKMATQTDIGLPLKSGGEFFIKAISSNSALILAPGKKITITQPAMLTGGVDSLNVQQAFVFGLAPGGIGPATNEWYPSGGDTVYTTASEYVFNMYQFNTPADSGSWCNSDNTSYFSAFPQTQLTLLPNDNANIFQTEVFLVFHSVSSMVHVYCDWSNNNFPYFYAPQGLECTLVAIGVKSGTLYSSFVPITIGSNQSVNFSLNSTNTTAFISQLKALN